MDRTSVARRIQLGAVRILQTKIAEASDGIMGEPQYVLLLATLDREGAVNCSLLLSMSSSMPVPYLVGIV